MNANDKMVPQHTYTYAHMHEYLTCVTTTKEKKNAEPYCAFCQSTAANSIKVIMNFAFDLMCKDYTYPSASVSTQRQRTSRIESIAFNKHRKNLFTAK